jgi:hypothetical protein
VIALDDLNPFARRFAQTLFSAYPEWRELAAVDTTPGAEPGSLALEVPSPAHPEVRLTLATEGGEVKVGLGAAWHTHFGSWTGADEPTSFAQALACIAEIVAEERVLAVGSAAGEPRCAVLSAEPEAFDASEADRLEVYSWRGTRDATVFPG